MPRGDRRPRAGGALRGRGADRDHDVARRRGGDRGRPPGDGHRRGDRPGGAGRAGASGRACRSVGRTAGHAGLREPGAGRPRRAGRGPAGRRGRPAAGGVPGHRRAGRRPPTRAAGTRRTGRVPRADVGVVAADHPGVRTAAGRLPDHRLPHQRVPRPRGRRTVRARRAQPDDRVPRLLPLRARARPVRARARVARPGPRGDAEPPPDDPVRAHPLGAGGLPGGGRRQPARVPAGPASLGDGRGPVGRLPDPRVRGHGDRRGVDRLQRPHPAHARRRPRLRDLRGALRRVGRRRPRCDPSHHRRVARRRHHRVVVRSGSLEPAGLRRAPRARRDRLDLGRPQRGGPGPGHGGGRRASPRGRGGTPSGSGLEAKPGAVVARRQCPPDAVGKPAQGAYEGVLRVGGTCL